MRSLRRSPSPALLPPARPLEEPPRSPATIPQLRPEPIPHTAPSLQFLRSSLSPATSEPWCSRASRPRYALGRGLALPRRINRNHRPPSRRIGGAVDRAILIQDRGLSRA